MEEEIEKTLALIKISEKEMERREVSIEELKEEVKSFRKILGSLRTQVKGMRLVEDYNRVYKETGDHFLTQKELSYKYGMIADSIKNTYYKTKKKLRNEQNIHTSNEEII